VASQALVPLLVVVGETASGKTELAIRIAKQFNGEIICADSWTVRRGLDIGTAKPSQTERTEIRHHLLDVVAPDEDFTAAVFKRMTVHAIQEISDRGKLPILVGGTGLYIDSVLYDYGFLEQGDRKLRKALNELSVHELLQKAADMNLNTRNIDQGNKRRIIRLIETNGASPTKKSMRQNTLMIGLRTARQTLRLRIEKRIDDQINEGLQKEVRDLSQTYGWRCEGMKGVGYAQWMDYFSGRRSLEETKAEIVKATLDLAKKQRTWFKRNKSIHWIDNPVNWSEVVALVTTLLSK
jgi:tRNA dimethylallyltransferase